MADAVLGLDLGTTGIKAVLVAFGQHGCQVLGESVAAYPLSSPQPNWSEQNPADWWQGTVAAIREVVQRSAIHPDRIAGIALSGQMHGATLLDDRGSVLRPCILWNDQRSSAQCTAITERVGLDNLIRWVANPALAGFTAPKLLWVREHEPGVFRRTASILLPKDYLNFLLTGCIVTEPSDASGTLLFDVARRCWSASMLEALDISPDLLPPVIGSTEIVGGLTARAAQLTGLRAGTPVIAGGADNACAALGNGVLKAGQTGVSLGTSGTVIAPSAQPAPDPLGRLHTFCHVTPDTWYLMGVVLSAGGSLRWFRDALAPEIQSAASAGNPNAYDILLDEAMGIPAGSEGLIFLPYLTGERTPHGDPHARGVFFGLSPRHSRAHLVRSILEGVCFALGDSVGIMRDLGLPIAGVRATGGGARSILWRQILADVLAAPVRFTTADSGPAFGAAILAATGAGILSSVSEVDGFIAAGEQVEPDPDSSSRYREYQQVFDSLYPALQTEFAALAQLPAP
ncbi:MAG: xylulokinase [Chloroflexota bacterium]